METPAFPIVMKLLEVKHQALQDCLIKHSIIIRGEFVSRPLNITQATDRRDAFVKVQCWRRGPRIYSLNMAPCPVYGEREKAETAGQGRTLPVTCLVIVGFLAILGLASCLSSGNDMLQWVCEIQCEPGISG